MFYQKIISVSVAGIAVILFCIAHFYSSPLVGEEARYSAVAWQMFTEKHLVFPQYGNDIYLEKMPLLFWFLNAGWAMQSTWPWEIILPALFAVLTVYYTQKLGKLLFVTKPMVSVLAPLVLVCMPFFLSNLGLLRFDMLLTLLNVAAGCCLVQAQTARRYYWYFVLINILGVFAKGPVFYIFTLVESALFFLFFSSSPVKNIIQWWGGALLSLCPLLGYFFGIVYVGASPFLPEGDAFYAIFYRQVIARLLGNHNMPVKPWWDYCTLLPCFFLPWMLFTPFLKVKSWWGDGENNKKAVSFIVYSSFALFLLFSVIKTKEARYLLPLTPFFALIISYHLQKIVHTSVRQDYNWNVFFLGCVLCLGAAGLFFVHYWDVFFLLPQWLRYFPVPALWVIAGIGCLGLMSFCWSVGQQVFFLLGASFMLTTCVELVTSYIMAKPRDMTLLAHFIRQQMAANRPVASSIGALALDMQFLGRLPKRLPDFQENSPQLARWTEDNPTGWLVTWHSVLNPQEPAVSKRAGCFEQRYDYLQKVIYVCPVSRDFL